MAALSTSRAWAFTSRPWPLRVLIAVSVLTALVLPVVPGGPHPGAAPHAEVVTAFALLALSVVNVEFGRLLDGGVKHSQRPHKALSAWALGAALLLPTWWLVPIVAAIYAHARWRGLRVQLWKWVGSGAYVVLAALAAGFATGALTGTAWAHGSGVWVSGGPRVLLAVGVAVAVFLLVESALLHASALLNDAEDEVWLRRTLAGPRFYVTEAAVLLVGGLSAALWAVNPWLLPLLLPVYGLTQQAALHEPLRQQAATDAKTGLYRYEPWRQLALAERDRCTSKQRPWAVVFADLDQFKPYNDAWGHLAGDAALAAVADLFRAQLRSRDIVGRFGGEEFSLFLPDTTPDEASEVAERLRAAIEALRLPDTGAGITMSLGVAGVEADYGDVGLADALHRADAALYEAKHRGRNAACMLRVAPEYPAAEAPAAGERPRSAGQPRPGKPAAGGTAA